MPNRINNEQFLEKLKELHIQSIPLQVYNTTKSVLDVSKRMEISTTTVRSYLHIGEELNLISVSKEHNCPFCKKQIDSPGGLATHIKYCKLRRNESLKT